MTFVSDSWGKYGAGSSYVIDLWLSSVKNQLAIKNVLVKKYCVMGKNV